MITILLADDHRVVRQGLRALLQTEPGFDLLGEAEDGIEALEMTERLRPDVLVLDLMMPGLGGLEVTAEVRQRRLRTQVVILSMYSEEAYVAEALRRGARGYVLKNAGIDELARAIREVAAGGLYVGAALAEKVALAEADRDPDDSGDPAGRLTRRERQVLHLSAEGLSASEVAARLGIGVRTVETHRQNLLRKLGLHGQTELVRFALRRGIIPPD